MAAVARGRFIGFFAEDDFIDEAGCGGIRRGHPGNCDAGEFLLEPFQEAHEIPDGENVVGGK